MTTINLSVSNFLAFQNWKAGLYNYSEMDALEFCHSLIKPFEKKPQMAYGTAVHEYLEVGNKIKTDDQTGIISTEDDLYISFAELGDAVKVRQQMVKNNWILEPWAPSKEISQYGYKFKIRGRLDAKNEEKKIIVDHKILQPWNGSLKSGWIDKYMISPQWKFYLWMTNYPEFWYSIFIKNPFKRLEGNVMVDCFKIRFVDHIKLFYDEEVESQCKSMISEFIEFLFSMDFINTLWEHQETKRLDRLNMPV